MKHGMRHLSGLDASFLHLETPEMPMHVGSLHLLDLPAGPSGDFIDTVKRHVADRLHLASVFTKKLALMPLDIANPVWIDDDDLDLDYHIRQVTLPRPGTQVQLEAYVGRLHSSLLDRSRPLWEFYVLSGLQSGQLGFYTKIHHAALDGQGALVLAQALLDVTPAGRTVEPPPPHERAPYQPPVSRMLRAALFDTLSQCVKLVRGVPTGLRVAAGLLAPSRDEHGKRHILPGKLSMAPRTPLNVSITNQRAFATVSIDVKQAQAVGDAFDATLNDAVLGIVSGALRRYLDEHGALPDKPLVAAVPVSLRAEGDIELNNQVSMMLMKIGSDQADPRERMRAIVKASSKLKKTVSNVKSVLPTDFPSLGVPWMMSAMVSLYGRARLADTLPPLANVVVSNVPGPRMPLYLAGARMASNFPVSIVTHGLGLNVTVQSYNGSLDFGIIACRRAMPDIALFADCMLAAHRELLDIAQASLVPAAPKRRRAAPKPASAKKSPAPPKALAKRRPRAPAQA
jgi:diacylglycerol O-acyltransferase / wax synthase